MQFELKFDLGTLLLDGVQNPPDELQKLLVYDPRVKCFRAAAHHYAALVMGLRRAKLTYIDHAKAFTPITLPLKNPLAPRVHQNDALKAWLEHAGRAITVMPTGSGKTYLAALAIDRIRRPALVLVPTIDLMQQWSNVLERFFGCRVGMLGGGSREIQELTVSTYDSAVLNMEFIGNRFGLIIFDECHHLPGPVNRTAASMSLAPYRLGLTATPECDDAALAVMNELIGPIAYRIDIDQLEGNVLAPYEVRRLQLQLEEDEIAEYQYNRGIYVDFIRRHNLTFSEKNDWAKFLGLCAREPNGRATLDAYLRQRRLARAGRGKIDKVWELIHKHYRDRVIIFTADNDSAYTIGEKFLLPVLTHHTRAAERKEMLDKFRSGEYPVLVTSKVLNEGVDVPEAGVGIVFSGSGSIREHVQRLGRILRARDGKRAILYELISENTAEFYVSQRRREHRAYQRRKTLRIKHAD